MKVGQISKNFKYYLLQCVYSMENF
jgi:hypothetical protein